MLETDYEALAGDLRKQAEQAGGEEARELYRRSSTLYRKAAEKTGNREKASALNQLAEQLDKEAEKALQEEPGDQETSKENSYFSKPPSLDFSDVGGMKQLKKQLREQVITQLQDTGFREPLKVSPTNGVLLYGPPGTGKTYISKALAGELGFQWAEVDTADLVSKYVGESAQQVQKLFQEALQAQPCIIFLDEIDAVASPRETGSKTESEQQRVNQFLQSLDRIQGEDILVIAATNLVDEVDTAIRRSGRFDEEIHVGYPDKKARRQILKIHLKEREHRVSSKEQEQVAAATSGFSASDLKTVVEKAAQQAHIDSIEDDLLQPINYNHLVSTVTQHTDSGGDDK